MVVHTCHPKLSGRLRYTWRQDETILLTVPSIHWSYREISLQIRDYCKNQFSDNLKSQNYIEHS
jgi:hypothetical protein